MSAAVDKQNPEFWIDVSGWNDIEISRLPPWISGVWVKTTQGDDFINPLMERQCRATINKGKALGLYHFLDGTATADEQFDHFMNTVGELAGKAIAPDFEPYGNWSPSNATLEHFNQKLRREIGPDKPIGIYTNKNFWDSGTPSGRFRQYHADYAWNARYPLDGPGVVHRDPRKLYFDLLRKNWIWITDIGGADEYIEQYTSAGLVANRFVDCNAAIKPTTYFTGAGVPGVPRQPRRPDIQKDVDKVMNYLEGTIGGRYVQWVGGPFSRRAPAWVRRNAPAAHQVREEGMFCAAAITLALLRLGLPLPIPADPEWEGGLLDYGRDYIHDLKIAEPYNSRMKVNPLDLFLTEYTGPALENQGHTWLMWKGDKCYQSDLAGGINVRRTLKETIGTLTHGKKVWIVRREKWMRR